MTTTATLLESFLQKAYKNSTVKSDRREYATMITAKQQSFLSGLYRKETKDWECPIGHETLKVDRFEGKLYRCPNGSYNITFTDYSIKY